MLRDVEPGSTVDCTLCGERVKFQAKIRHKQVICNVYEEGRLDTCGALPPGLLREDG